MPNAKDVEITTEKIKFAVCGDAGSGKSQFGSTFPQPGFLFDVDNHVQSYRGADFDYEQFPKNPTGWPKLEKKISELQKLARSEEPFPYKSVILDSTTSLTELAMERALMIDPKRNNVGGPLWNVHYSMVKNLVEGAIRRIKELPCTVLVVMHLKVITDEDSGAVVAIKPLLGGNLPDTVPSWFDEIYYADTRSKGGKTEWFLRTTTKGFYKARSVLSGAQHLLPETVANDYNEIVKILKEKEGN